VVESQIANLIPDPSFGHNLCFKCPNGSCKPILNIYVPRAFQWYKELFDPMGFDPWNFSLKIWESIETPTPKVGVHLGVWGFIPSHSLVLPRAWNVTLKLHIWFAPSQAFALIASPRLGLWHVVTYLQKMNKRCCLLNWKKQKRFKNTLQTLVFYKIFPMNVKFKEFKVTMWIQRLWRRIHKALHLKELKVLVWKLSKFHWCAICWSTLGGWCKLQQSI